MALKDDLTEAISRVFKSQWTTRDGTVVPSSENIPLANEAVKLDGTVLYADLSASTSLVDTQTPFFAAEIYKAYLYCAARIIRSEGGEITAYDGDRVMAVFLGNSKNTSAVRTGLKINWAVKNLINPALKAQYPQSNYEVQQTVGIDSSLLHVARTGIRGSNDLVWVGRAANHAAKLCALPPTHPTRITAAIYGNIHESVKKKNGIDFWERMQWTAMNNVDIYRTTWWWSID